MFAQLPSMAKYMHVCKKHCSWDVPLELTTKNLQQPILDHVNELSLFQVFILYDGHIERI